MYALRSAVTENRRPGPVSSQIFSRRGRIHMPRLRTPGPGAYDSPAHMTISGSMGTRPTASFASNSKRDKKANNDSAGDPGAYTIDRGGVQLGKKETIAGRYENLRVGPVEQTRLTSLRPPREKKVV